uniref:Uncharacterized protein n=1 Tax=Setaria viridis TaxID=4556 RepID=A0A4V6DCS4_SETVI|nr:hypothetical protein SEVIR_1G131400v2 [Setaria viridis]
MVTPRPLKRSRLPRQRAKGLDSTVMMCSWAVWKERNNRTFDTARERSPQELLIAIHEEAANWLAAGARCLATTGWTFGSTADGV